MKTWTVDEIRDLLNTRDDAVIRGMIRIYHYQTAQEQYVGETRECNGVGFNGFDSEFLSSLCEQVKKGRSLSPKQIFAARRKMLKYSRQLMKVANGDQ